MLARAMTHKEYYKFVNEYREKGKVFLDEHTVRCYYTELKPFHHPDFGILSVTNKDFYAGVPDLTD